MIFQNLLSIAGAVLLSLGGGAAIVFAISKYLSEIIASRILEQKRSVNARNYELLVRRRNVYARLALTLRVFLKSGKKATPEQQEAFLAAYDESALWASEEVIAAVGALLDMNIGYTSIQNSILHEAQKDAYVACVTAMRKDCGFPETKYKHHVVSFLDVS